MTSTTRISHKEVVLNSTVKVYPCLCRLTHCYRPELRVRWDLNMAPGCYEVFCCLCQKRVLHTPGWPRFEVVRVWNMTNTFITAYVERYL